MYNTIINKKEKIFSPRKITADSGKPAGSIHDTINGNTISLIYDCHSNEENVKINCLFGNFVN